MDDQAIDLSPFIPIQGYAPQKFDTHPPEAFIASFREHVRKTGRPEDFPGLYYGPIDRAEPLTMLCSIGIARRQRIGSDVPCPICKNPSQFLDGYLVWFHERGRVAAIGATCAKKIEEAASVFSESAQDQIIRMDMKWRLPLTMTWQAEIKQALHAAETYRLARANFDKIGRKCRGALIPILKSGGELSAIVDDTFVSYGMVVSGEALTSPYNADGLLRECAKLIDRSVCSSDPASVEARISELSVASRLRSADTDLKNIQSKFKAAVAQLDRFRAFFDPTQLGRIAKWGKTLGDTVRFDMGVSTTATKCTVTIDGHRAEIPCGSRPYPAVLTD